MEPYLFFQIVDRMKLGQAHLAREMGISKATFTLVKQGKRPLTPRFAEAGTGAFERLDVRHPEGRPYRRDELFRRVPMFTNVHDLTTEVA